MRWSQLAGQAVQFQASAAADLTDLLLTLWKAQQAGKKVEAVAGKLELYARAHAFDALELGALAQQSDFTNAPLSAQLYHLAAAFAEQRGTVVRDRALDVLKDRPEAFVSPYARLAAQVLVTDALRTGTTAAGLDNGATHKEFIRIRSVQEERAHSRLEGVVIPVDDLFNIGGYLVYGPGDEQLPWSEKAWCGHALRFRREE